MDVKVDYGKEWDAVYSWVEMTKFSGVYKCTHREDLRFVSFEVSGVILVNKPNIATLALERVWGDKKFVRVDEEVVARFKNGE